MSDPSPFPPLPEAALTRNDVVNFLLALKGQGHDVYQDPKNEHAFFLVLNDLNRIRFSIGKSSSKCQIQGIRYNDPMSIADVTSHIQLEQASAAIARKLIGAWPIRPSRGRLSGGSEADNYQTIANLIGSSSIEAVFDPYLENRSLTMITNILSFGDGSVTAGVRLLGSTRTTGGAIPRFTKAGVDAWLAQMSIAGEARVMSPTDQHRRFILLSGGQSLILGPSLNSIHKNEATFTDRDTEDRVFFDGVWATANSLT